MDGTMISRVDLPELARKDEVNAIPTLMLLSAIDPCFPSDESWVYKYLVRSRYGTLHIDFGGIRASGMLTGSLLALVDLAHDLWNGDAKTQMNHVMHRCDGQRRRRVVEALIASAERGHGTVSKSFLKELVATAPTHSR